MGLSVADLLEALPFSAMLVDDERNILFANRAARERLAAKSLGFDRGVLGPGYCPDVIHGLDRPWSVCSDEETVKKQRPVEREAFDEISGRWLRLTICPIKRPVLGSGRIYVHLVADITGAKRAEAELRASQAQLRELSSYLEGVREDERAKVAREIHDELGQLLTALKIELLQSARRSTDNQEALSRKTESMLGLVDEAIQTVKRISTELRPSVLDDLGLSDALEWLTNEFARRTGIHCTFRARPAQIQADRERSTALFRICQEALTNVARHAQASKVAVALDRTARALRLRVEDDGRGIEPERIADPRAFGLLGMRERACSFGGKFTIVGIPERGTLVLVVLPLCPVKVVAC